MDRLGWDELDVLLVTGDAYVDHPAFGPALLGRWLVAHGFRAGIVAQPRWAAGGDVQRMGRPRLFAGVTAGALDSMVAHYTAFRKIRRDDAYTPGGRAGARPNRHQRGHRRPAGRRRVRRGACPRRSCAPTSLR